MDAPSFVLRYTHAFRSHKLGNPSWTSPEYTLHLLTQLPMFSSLEMYAYTFGAQKERSLLEKSTAPPTPAKIDLLMRSSDFGVQVS